MVMTRAAALHEYWPGVLEWFGEYDERETQYGQIYSTKSSNKAYEEFVMRFGLGLAVKKGELESVQFDDSGNAWRHRIENEGVGLGFILSREAIADGLYGDILERNVKNLRRSQMETREILAVDHLEGGFTTSVGGDAVTLFHAAHPLAGGGTFANRPTATADYSEQSLEAALITISQWTDERGFKVGITGQRSVVPPHLEYVAARLHQTQMRPGTADNDVNAMRVLGRLPQGAVVNHRLTSNRAWYIITSVTDDGQGMIHFDREPMEIFYREGGDNLAVKVLSYSRYAFGHGDPRGAYGMPAS